MENRETQFLLTPPSQIETMEEEGTGGAGRQKGRAPRLRVQQPQPKRGKASHLMTTGVMAPVTEPLHDGGKNGTTSHPTCTDFVDEILSTGWEGSDPGSPAPMGRAMVAAKSRKCKS